MKRILILLTVCCAVLSCACVLAEEEGTGRMAYTFLNGFPVADLSDYDYTEDPKGVFYDPETQTLLSVSDDADPGEVLAVAPGTRYIASGALQLNEKIREIRLPDSVEVIGPSALTGHLSMAQCAAVETVYVPASVRLIHEPLGFCFYSYGTGKPAFIVDGSNSRYVSTADGLLIDKLDQAVLWCADSPETRVVTVPEGIRRIAPYAFAQCTNVVSVQLPDSLVEIGEGAFCMMYGLVEITIPENVLRIGSRCFSWSGIEYEWCLDKEDNIVERFHAEEDCQELTDEEVLRHFGIERRPGIHFRGTEFLLSADPEETHYNGFGECGLAVECPAGALYREYLEYSFRDIGEPYQLTVIEPDGTTREFIIE